jgi:hypothetical protein
LSPIETPSPVHQSNDLYPYLNVDDHASLIIAAPTASERAREAFFSYNHTLLQGRKTSGDCLCAFKKWSCRFDRKKIKIQINKEEDK